MPRFHSLFPTRKRSTLFIGLLFLAMFLGFSFFVAPNSQVQLVIFFALFGLTLFFLVGFVANTRRLGFLVSGGGVLILFLRLIHLRSPLYPILIILLVITLEFFFRKKQTHT